MASEKLPFMKAIVSTKKSYRPIYDIWQFKTLLEDFQENSRGGVTFCIIAILNQSSYFKRYSRRLLLKTLTHFFLMFPLDPAENRDQKGILGRKGLTAFDVIKRLLPTILYNVNEDIA